VLKSLHEATMYSLFLHVACNMYVGGTPHNVWSRVVYDVWRRPHKLRRSN